MEQIKGLLIDLDGTLYHGHKMIPGADLLIKGLREAGIPFYLLPTIHRAQRLMWLHIYVEWESMRKLRRYVPHQWRPHVT